MEFNFIKQGHATTNFDTVVIVGEEFKINMIEEVSHLPLGPPHALSPISRRSVRHTKMAVAT